MRNLYRAALTLFAALSAYTALAAESQLTIVQRGEARTYSTTQLLQHPAITRVDTDRADEAYKRPMRYSAIPIGALLGDIGDADEAQFIALDGYAPTLSTQRLAGVGKAQAYLAIESKSDAWPALGAGKPSAGPFYLIWSNADGASISPGEWPYQIATIRLQRSIAARYPKITPAADASEQIKAGFATYAKECLPCHTINGQGEASMGPDLNLPMNPTEYFTETALRKLIRDPKSVRDWGSRSMPGFDRARISDADLENVIAYLKHMASKNSAAR